MGKTYEYCYEEAIGISKLKDALSTAGIIILKETSIQHGTKFIFQNGAAIILYCSKSKTSKIYVEKETTEIIAFLENLCMQEKRIESIPIYASFTVHSDKFLDIKQAIIRVLIKTNNEFMSSMLFGLPPFAEQQRIVAEIEKYEPLITEYDKLEQQKTKLDGEIYDKLKKSILQYAIQGKLVPQDENDAPASELLKRIRDEKKAQLGKKYVDSYIYKGDDNCYYEHIDGKDKDEAIEVPFDLPDDWAWCKLTNIIKSITDGTHSTPKYTQNGIPFVSVKDISSGELKLNDTKYISIKEHKELSKRCNPQRGDILLTKVGTTGIPVLINVDIEFSLFVSVALIKFNHNYILPDYFIYLLKSPLVQMQAVENTRGVGNKNWVLSDIEKTILAIPPLAEQQRIVNKINEIFAKL